MKVRVQKFQALDDVTLDVEGLTVIVGPSNRGKSSLIRAIEAALFNKPGDSFVRKGAKTADVTLDGVPDATGRPHAITWTKGKSSACKYRIDGEPYGKTGGDAPPPVQAMGYRDLWIGDKDRKKGEYLRPQVASQFDPLFLLTRSGAFIADVLNLVTRQQVLTTAQDRCAADLRSTKQQAGLKVSERATVAGRLESLAGVPALLNRLDELGQWQMDLDHARARADRVRQLAMQRARLRAFIETAGPSLDTKIPYETVLASRILNVARTIGLLRRRVAVVAVPRALPTPATTWPELVAFLQRRKGLASGVQTRRRLAPLGGRTLPAPVQQASSATWDRTLALRAQVDRLVTIRNGVLMYYRQQEMSASAIDVEHEQAEARYAEALADSPLCPVCERPWSPSNAAVTEPA